MPPFDTEVAHIARHRLDRLAEAAREGQEAGWRQVLVAEEDDQVLEPGLADGRDRGVVEILAEIHAGDLGPEGAGERFDREGARHAVHIDTSIAD